MKKITLVLLGLFLLANQALAQYKNDNTWILGNPNKSPSTSPFDSLLGGMNITFSEKGIEIKKAKRYAQMDQYNAVGNDSNGNLVFYTNGCAIYDQYDTVMYNGKNLNTGSKINKQWCDAYNYLPAGFQEAMVIPFGDSLFYLLHQRTNYINGIGLAADALLFTKIKWHTLKNRYEIISKNDTLLFGAFDSGHLTAVKHTNGKDWWIITVKCQSNEYNIIKLGKNGFSEIKKQIIGKIPVEINQGGGAAIFSPNGKKYVRYDNYEKCYIFDFDREIGKMSNPINLQTDSIGNANLLGSSCMIEPNSRFLYIAAGIGIFQFDLQAKDILASKVILAESTKEKTLTVSRMILAPDCKIYIIPSYAARYMHVIEKPTLKDTACGFSYQAFKFPFYNNFCLPYFPNYRLGTPYEDLCKTSTDLKEDLKPKPIIANLYPNPASGVLNLDLFGYVNQYKKGVFSLYDLQGKLIEKYTLLINHDEYRFDVSNLANGMYFWQLSLDDKIVKTGKIVVMNE